MGWGGPHPVSFLRFADSGSGQDDLFLVNQKKLKHDYAFYYLFGAGEGTIKGVFIIDTFKGGTWKHFANEDTLDELPPLMFEPIEKNKIETIYNDIANGINKSAWANALHVYRAHKVKCVIKSARYSYAQ